MTFNIKKTASQDFVSAVNHIGNTSRTYIQMEGIKNPKYKSQVQGQVPNELLASDKFLEGSVSLLTALINEGEKKEKPNTDFLNKILHGKDPTGKKDKGFKFALRPLDKKSAAFKALNKVREGLLDFIKNIKSAV